ncbi:MAG: type IV pilus twitching motility protein PilT [Candidatus Dojkabacteria bacterium]|jgi:twitching motility protein PilT
MENTAQNTIQSTPQVLPVDQNTSQVQSIPTSAPQTTPVATPPKVPVSQQIESKGVEESQDERLEQLRQSLNDLLNVENTPQQESVTSPTPPTDTVAPPVEQYLQTVTPLPGIQDVKNEEKDISTVIDSVMPDTPPIQSKIKPDTPLKEVIPDEVKPRAMTRDPKSNNLATPVVSPADDGRTISGMDVSLDDSNTVTVESRPAQSLTIDKLLSEAIKRSASDLHISVGYPPILRVDGVLVDMEEKVLTPEDVEELIFSVLSDEKKELLEVNREIDFAYLYNGAVSARFRVNAYYSMKNLSAAFRLIPSRVRTIEELMLPSIYHQLTKLKQGLILVTGPTGHGKSTTLAAMLEDINRTRFSHIVTIEDPVEYVFEGKKALIDQREMNDDTLSWNIALRSALRQDPDVILVGEMRDYETIAAAITLAETGHLVFATLHTNSAAQTVDRIIDVFPENQQQQVRAQIASTLEAVIAQRLVPLDKGGRRAVSEIMLNNSAIANLIREGKTHQIDNVIRTSSDVGMIYLEKALVALVREGVISVQKAQEYAVHPEEVLRLLKS